MEEATVGRNGGTFKDDEQNFKTEQTTQDEEQQSGFFNDNRFPDVVDTDDLVWELGKDKVRDINKTKLIDKLYGKLKESYEELSRVKSEYNKLIPSLESLKATKDKLTEHNKKLDKSLVEERSKKDNLSKENRRIKSENDTLKKQIDSLKEELNSVKQDNDELLKRIKL